MQVTLTKEEWDGMNDQIATLTRERDEARTRESSARYEYKQSLQTISDLNARLEEAREWKKLVKRERGLK